MKKAPAITLVACFVISLSLNILLYLNSQKWKEAWVEQVTTTSDIEYFFKNLSENTDFDSMLKVAKAYAPTGTKVIDIDSEQMVFGADKKAIDFNGTKLFFSNGIYIGSKANLPSSLVENAF